MASQPPLSKVQRIERALVLAAYIVTRHGEKYAGYIDRLEAELAEARKVDPMARAQAILDRYTRAGGVNAIPTSQSRLPSSDRPSP
ncbi:hypothetical protein [Camelimonas lactis]|uniref:Uncharacterized protein n=1 Tax=Camelimonas lactis TaxID=659006 RepID=A0A4R2GZ08_9HYPH|nr:hypothetical protein [Camelimonas lactis]TCO15846.1 hypothetical protein EV666_10195 [Camelimonas lactis]